MKVRLIYPRFQKFRDAHPELAELPAIAGLWKYRMPPALGLRILATLMPDDVEWGLTDANVQRVDFDEDVDLVAISCFTPQAESAYEIADTFRARGVPVVLGGMHPSIYPEDAQPHCDALCAGEAEEIWPVILDDARRGRLQPLYTPSMTAPAKWVRPVRGLFEAREHYDWNATLVQVARGCPRACPYCNIPVLQGDMLRFRPIDDVVDEISGLTGRDFYLTEDVLMFKAASVTSYTSELFRRIAEHDARMFLTSTLVFNHQPAFLDLMAKAGTRCVYTTFGFDPISRGVYDGNPKYADRARMLIDRIQERGMRFYGAFGFGFDEDDPGVFDRVLRFCEDASIMTAEFFIATPFPNTPLFHQLRREDRLFHTRWSEYNCANVVFQPKQMTPEQLHDGFVSTWRAFYEDRDMEMSLDCFTHVRPTYAAPPEPPS